MTNREQAQREAEAAIEPTRGRIMQTRGRILDKLDAMAAEHEIHAIKMAANEWWEYVAYDMEHPGTKGRLKKMKLDSAKDATHRASNVAHNQGKEMIEKQLAMLADMME